MKQAIILEASDLATLRRGLPLVIHVGDSSIELMVHSNNNKDAIVITPWTCPKCQKSMHPQGRGPHNRMHIRNKK